MGARRGKGTVRRGLKAEEEKAPVAVGPVPGVSDRPLGAAQAASLEQACKVLSPLFLKDPATGAGMRSLLCGIVMADAADVARGWPFAGDAVVRRAFAEMRSSLSADGTPSEAMVWDYRRLFVGPEKMPCPPWGSVYTDYEQVVFGESDLALAQWMRLNGISRKDGAKEPADHIGRMLELLGWLSAHRPQLVPEYLKEHLLTWSSHYLDELAQAARDPFYHGLAVLTKATLEGLQEGLGVHVSYPRFYR